MIPFASQRASGQDLATHLLNAEDNEHVMVMDVRGALANDLHGAFAEWQLQADALTNCRNYLYSLSINPDPAQGRLTQEQYRDYVERVEKALGLEGQPRAVVFHIKHDREHAHIVWSRIDAEAGKAVQLSFDREKLMRVTRQFARDHGLELAGGYDRDHDNPEKSSQLSLYDKHQQDTTGLTREQRMELVTELWRTRDSAKAFVRALGEHGYMLARGNRPYVLVDIHGDTNALPRLIDDKSVRAKDVRAFLERDFPPETLPSVDEAKALAAKQRKDKAIQDKLDREAAAIKALSDKEAERRRAALTKVRELAARQNKERAAMKKKHHAERVSFRAKRLELARSIRQQRLRARPKGLARFLGRVTGMEHVIKRIRQYRDRNRRTETRQLQAALIERQRKTETELVKEHRLVMENQKRSLRSVMKVEKREQRSRAIKSLRRARQEQRARRGVEHLDAIDSKSYEALLSKGVEKAPKQQGRDLEDWRSGWNRLSHQFTKAADEFEKGEAGDRGDKTSKPKLAQQEEVRRRQQRRRDQDKER
ncbi:MAG: relaxase/mobilization nuclease domain-containing protein [Rhodospirillales bacterium]